MAAPVAQAWTFGPGGVYTASWDGVSKLTVTLTTGGAFVASFSGTSLSQVTSAAEFQALATGSAPVPAPLALALVAATPAAGFALVNGTPTIWSWTAPADGQNHRALLITNEQVSSALTGGQVTMTLTTPDGSTSSPQVYAASAAGGFHSPNANLLNIKAGTVVTLQQASAVTVGAGIVWAELWAA
jgi:hypothetical protein